MARSLIQDTRQRILRTALRATVLLGGLAYVPGAWASFRTGVPEVVILSTTIYTALLLITFLPGLSFRQRGTGLVGILYVLAMGLLLTVGPPGAGAVWLTAVPVMAGVLFGVRGALWSLAGVAVTVGLFGVLIHLGHAVPLPATQEAGYTVDAWAATAGSLLFISAVLALCVGTLVERLEAVALQERESRVRLEESTRDRLLLEARLRESRKLEAIGTLAGGVAHDFNNLLVPLVAGTEEARAALPPDSPILEQLDDVLRSAARGRDLVKRILTFSRGTDGNPVPIRVSELVEEVARLLGHTLPASIRLETTIEVPQASVLADPVELHQVLMNLGTNAHFAMRDAGGVLTLSSSIEGDEVLLEVTDTGVGMAPGTLERALDPFFTTRSPDEGTGLGLSTVHGIVRSLGGSITLESEPGLGTSVRVRLPLHGAADAPAAGSPLAEGAEGRSGEGMARPGGERVEPDARTGDPSLGAGCRILIVEDDPAVRKVTVRLLGRLGFDVLSADSGDAALEHLRRRGAPEIDVLLTDQTMSGMSGLELLDTCRREGRAFPAVLMSGFLGGVTEARARAYGARVLPKPFHRHELMRTLREAIDSPLPLPPPPPEDAP